MQVLEAVEGLTVHASGDLPGSHVPALEAIAHGSGLADFLLPQLSCGPETTGYPCFRRESLPVIILITDTLFHNGPDGEYPYDPDV